MPVLIKNRPHDFSVHKMLGKITFVLIYFIKKGGKSYGMA